MNEIILSTNHITKIYNGKAALSDVSISLKSGKIYGLIGRNGAGKSTLMRIIAGLSNPTDGDFSLFGYSNQQKIQTERRRIGCMIEAPSLIINLSAKENIHYHRLLRGIVDELLEEELLNLVGLKNTEKKKVKHFSLGMKQRLGIAITLLGNPELLILDEPINGLDPLGVIEIRELLLKLMHEREMTILISSHNLPELYQIATDYIIINDGEIKQEISLEALNQHCQHHLLIESESVEDLVNVIETKLKTRNYIVLPNRMVKLYDYVDEKEKVGKLLFENNIPIYHLSNEGDTLEAYFISVIGGSIHA